MLKPLRFRFPRQPAFAPAAGSAAIFRTAIPAILSLSAGAFCLGFRHEQHRRFQLVFPIETIPVTLLGPDWPSRE